MTIEPFIRYAGSKRQLLDVLLPILNEALAKDTTPIYVEPFLGGGSVALNVDAHDKRVLADLSVPLIITWQQVQLQPQKILSHLKTMEVSQANYYRCRSVFNARLHSRHFDPARLAAEFLYLNRLCYNGLWRVNRQGLFNVPWGGREKPMIGEDVLLGVHHLLAFKARILQGDAVSLLGGWLDSKQPLVVYADPPYDGTFSSYGADGFGPDEQRELAEVLQALASKGHAIVASNADTPFVRDVYSWADVTPIDEKRKISSDGDRTDAKCVLIRSNC